MFDAANNAYDVDEEINRDSSQRTVDLHKMEGEEGEEVVVIAGTNYLFDKYSILSPSLLKLRIRNTIEYLKWRIAILKRDTFKCQVCSASNKNTESVRPEVHHVKTLDDICKENNIKSVKGSLTCKEICSLDNGISLCYCCHQNIEKLRTKIRNM
jgi:hypothetical protein